MALWSLQLDQMLKLHLQALRIVKYIKELIVAVLRYRSGNESPLSLWFTSSTSSLSRLGSLRSRTKFPLHRAHSPNSRQRLRRHSIFAAQSKTQRTNGNNLSCILLECQHCDDATTMPTKMEGYNFFFETSATNDQCNKPCHQSKCIKYIHRR